MALLEDRTAVFIVRIWCERGDDSAPLPEWRGSVEHVQTGKRTFFRHLEAVQEFMRPHLETLGIDAQQRFWERISSVMDDEREDDPALPHATGTRPAEIRFDLGSVVARDAADPAGKSR